MLQIAPKNSKLGRIPNTSFTPILSCASGVPCAKDCYALTSCYNRFQNVRNAWDKNYRFYLNDRAGYFAELHKYLSKTKSGYFRYFVGGDIPSQDYYNRMVHTARKFPAIRFLSFTKNHSIVFHNTLPENLSFMCSVWPNYPIAQNLQRFPKAYMLDPKNIDRRIPKNALICKGKCDKCLQCWEKGNFSIVLPIHGKGRKKFDAEIMLQAL